MLKVITAVVAAGVLGCATPVLAAQAQPQAASPSADMAAREELVRRYFRAIQFEKLMTGVMDSMMAPLVADTEIPEEKRDMVREAIVEGFSSVLPQMMEASVDMYAEAFTLTELEQLVAFYESPVGRSLMAKTVMLTQRTNETFERFQPLLEEAMRRELCSRMDCSAPAAASAGQIKGK